MADGQSASRPAGLSEDGLVLDMWYLAATSDELAPARHFRRQILHEPVLIGRDATGAVFAIRDICPHRAAPLSAGRQVHEGGQTTVECPYHGWRFGGDGQCRRIPSLVDGQPYEPGRIRVRSYPVAERQGMIFVFIPADPRFEGAPPLPAPEFPQAPGRPRFIISRVFRSHMDHAIVGLMDPAHVPYVHSQWWWRPPTARKRDKAKAFEPRELGWAMTRHQPSGNSLGYAILGARPSTEIVFRLPGYRWELIEAGRARVFTLTCLTPEGAGATRITQITYWSGAPWLSLLKPILRSAAGVFLDQDGRMVDLQAEGLRHQPALLWIDDIDVQAKWYHRLKREWADSRAAGREFVNPIEPRILRWRS